MQLWLLLLPLQLLPAAWAALQSPSLRKHRRRVLSVGGGTQALQEQQRGVVLYRGIQRCRLALGQPASSWRFLLLGWHRGLSQLTPPQQVS